MSPSRTRPRGTGIDVLAEDFGATFDGPPPWLTPEAMEWLAEYINRYQPPDRWLAVEGIPYVAESVVGGLPRPSIERDGGIAMPLWIDDEDSAYIRESEHWAVWHGKFPQDLSGERLSHIEAPTGNHELRRRLARARIRVLSQKPRTNNGNYPDYHTKTKVYASLIWPEARLIDPAVSFP